MIVVVSVRIRDGVEKDGYKVCGFATQRWFLSHFYLWNSKPGNGILNKHVIRFSGNTQETSNSVLCCWCATAFKLQCVAKLCR